MTTTTSAGSASPRHRFNTQDRAEREVAFRDLCKLCEVDPAPYLRR